MMDWHGADFSGVQLVSLALTLWVPYYVGVMMCG
jgi:hypothetical protein